MSFKNVKQLREFVFRYSDYDGSSKGVRQYLQANIIDFAKNNPETLISTEIKRSAHPFIRATYGNNVVKFFELIYLKFMFLYNSKWKR